MMLLQLVFVILLGNICLSQKAENKKPESSPKSSDGHWANMFLYMIKNVETKIQRQEEKHEKEIRKQNKEIEKHDEEMRKQNKEIEKHDEEMRKLNKEISLLRKNLISINPCPALLPVKWRGHCYGLFRYKLTFHQAQSHCRLFGANLVWIEDRAEHNFLTSTFSPQKICIWIGCNDMNHEGRFVWVHNNHPVTFSNWTPGEPNNSGNEDCCVMGFPHIHHGPGQWNDWYCNNPDPVNYFICKK